MQRLAAIPTPDPSAAASELERCIGVGFKGAMINGHVAGNVYLFAAAHGLASWFHHCEKTVAGQAPGADGP